MEELAEIRESLERKVERDELHDLMILARRLPTADDLHKLKWYVTDNIEKFTRDNRDFHQEFCKQCEIIRRYDEVLT